jgi:hypothetical protein
MGVGFLVSWLPLVDEWVGKEESMKIDRANMAGQKIDTPLSAPTPCCGWYSIRQTITHNNDKTG